MYFVYAVLPCGVPSAQKVGLMVFAEDDPEGNRHSAAVCSHLPNASLMRRRRLGPNGPQRVGKAMSFESVMEELSGLCRLVVVPKIPVDKAPEVIMFEQISDTQKQAFKLLNVTV